MKIHRLSGVDGSRAARGITAVVDVFRAFTCEPLMYHFGAAKIILMHDIEACMRFTGKALLVGEEDGCPIEGFDMANSPSQIIAEGRQCFEGRTVIHRTTSGVAGALAALECSDEVMLVSFAYAHCIAHGINMTEGLNEQKKAVASGHWMLYRYDPRLAEEGKNPLQIDSKEPTLPLEDYVFGENRYRVLKKSNPEHAQQLIELAKKDIERAQLLYRSLAAIDYGKKE